MYQNKYVDRSSYNRTASNKDHYTNLRVDSYSDHGSAYHRADGEADHYMDPNPVAYDDTGYQDPEIYEFASNTSNVLYAEDFNDTQRKPRSGIITALTKAGRGIAVVVFTMSFATLGVLASRPPMTPLDIVQMDGYQGAQRDPSLIFNLASLHGCSSISDCDRAVDSAADSAVKVSSANSIEQNISSVRNSAEHKPHASPLTADNTTGYAANVQEIPAAAERNPQADIRKSVIGDTLTPENLWKIRQQWSNVRDAPSMNGSIIVSLEADSIVSVVKTLGDWCEISTDKTASPPGISGYIHRSLLQPIPDTYSQ